PGILAASLAKGVDQVGKFTINASASELLWMPVAPVQKEVAKPLVKGAFKLIAEAIAGLTVFGVSMFATVGQISGLVVAALIAWIVVIAGLRQRYSEDLASADRKNHI